jgi:DNA-binding IscR family transcriptional regulator
MLCYLLYQQGAAAPASEITANTATDPLVIRRLLSALTKTRLVRAEKERERRLLPHQCAREYSPARP